MALIHPYEQVYFNFLVDRTTPEYLRTQYEMEYWAASLREGFEHLLERYPSSTIYIWRPNVPGNAEILPEPDRHRLVVNSPERADFYVSHHRRQLSTGRRDQRFIAPIYTRKVYNNTIMTVAVLDLSGVDDDTANAVRDSFRSVVSGEPVARSGYDIYLSGKTLNYVKDDCPGADEPWRFFLHVVPIDVNDLPNHDKPYLVENLDFSFKELGVQLDGKCWAAATLPDYDIAESEPVSGWRARASSGKWKYPSPASREAYAISRSAECWGVSLTAPKRPGCECGDRLQCRRAALRPVSLAP